MKREIEVEREEEAKRMSRHAGFSTRRRESYLSVMFF